MSDKAVKPKNCKSCGAEVDKTAKICPQCGAKLKMGIGKKLLIGFGIIIVLGWMIPDSPKDTTPTTAKVADKTPEQIAQEKVEAAKISASDKELLKKAYADFDSAQRTQFAQIKEKYKVLSNAEVADISADFVRLSNEEAAEVKKQAEAKAAADANAAYKKWIDDQFSSWDGSHRYLVNLIKENLNDPKSFDHVETNYWDRGDYLTVKMKYRAKNAFGGLILQNVTAKSDYKTNVISVISQND